ncbi:MAG: hypothetical protein HY606_05950 [Planctomycetes bacterium]|nr:hypothetical protein [Planctomycetota bacterium]
MSTIIDIYIQGDKMTVWNSGDEAIDSTTIIDRMRFEISETLWSIADNSR